MNEAIGLKDIESASLRSLVGCRSTSKAGIAVNSTSNTYTITIGAKQTDDIITVTVVGDAGTETATFTVLVGNANNDAVATAVASAIDALTDVTATAAAAVVTVVADPTTAAFTLTAAVTKAVGTPTTTATVAETIIGTKGVCTANTLDCIIMGHCGQKAATTDIAFAANGAVLPISSYRWYLLVANTSDAFVLVPGEDNKNFLPDIPTNSCPVGAFKVVTDASTTFTPGTTALNATGLTVTYFDLSCVPKAGYPA